MLRNPAALKPGMTCWLTDWQDHHCTHICTHKRKYYKVVVVKVKNRSVFVRDVIDGTKINTWRAAWELTLQRPRVKSLGGTG